MEPSYIDFFKTAKNYVPPIPTSSKVNWLTMIEAFANKIVHLTSKEKHTRVVQQTLKEVLGDTATSATIYYLGLMVLRDIKTLEYGLKTLFGPGAETILKKVLKNLGT
jgi:hypothetical protein